MVLGTTEIVVLLIVIAVLVFGAAKIPKIFRSMGRATGEFKKGKLEMEREIAAEFSSGTGSSGERVKLEKAARAYDIDPEGKSDSELRAAIKEAMA